jgi:subtilisin family serine protease
VQQWHHINDENNGGTDDADIDSDLAWDVTTGGNTAMGDTIVVCVIEGGNLEHPDLIGNAWFNYNEIPDNGIDDDLNGYVDDFRGWNVESEDDEGLYNGNHGTRVMGMIGATGDNDLGVVGANWNVKIMSVAGENIFDEASVVEAYTYPLVQRQLYNESDGNLGAFVVATNASWGIDGGNPNDVPIWSAFYDTLGVYGILNCGATSNSPVNIDEIGDIPTSVESIYMISVTATDNNDFRTFSAFGQTTIDLGAPGSSVYTTSGVEGYAFASGTSFASPLTAGVIGLMYSIPCPSFIEQVHANPQFGSDYVRAMLFQGVDPIENLELETVTGGRLNANNSIQLMMEQCGSDICMDPIDFNVEQTNDTSYTFSWSNVGENFSVVRMYLEGSTNYTYLENYDLNSFTIDTLDYCANYIFDIANNCEGLSNDELEYGSSIAIETLGCCVAPEELNSSNITETTAVINWESTLGISIYNVFSRIEGETEWNFVAQSVDNFIDLTELEPCTAYEFNVIPNCTAEFSAGAITSFTTLGCGACVDNAYCENFGEDTGYEFIESVQIGNYLNESGDNGGYAIFDNSGLELAVASPYPTILTPGFNGAEYPEAFSLWLDLNQDGIFEDDELLLSSPSASTEPLIGDLQIPSDAVLGLTRMRIVLKYFGQQNPGNYEPCEVYDNGETEDYCVTIVDSTNGINETYRSAEVNVYPNPSVASFTVSLSGVSLAETGIITLQMFDVLGKAVGSKIINSERTEIDFNLPSGIYAYQLVDSQDRLVSRGKHIIQK